MALPQKVTYYDKDGNKHEAVVTEEFGIFHVKLQSSGLTVASGNAGQVKGWLASRQDPNWGNTVSPPKEPLGGGQDTYFYGTNDQKKHLAQLIPMSGGTFELKVPGGRGTYMTFENRAEADAWLAAHQVVPTAGGDISPTSEITGVGPNSNNTTPVRPKPDADTQSTDLGRGATSDIAKPYTTKTPPPSPPTKTQQLPGVVVQPAQPNLGISGAQNSQSSGDIQDTRAAIHPPPYQGGAPVVSTEYLANGSTLVTTSTGAQIQSLWVDPSDPSKGVKYLPVRAPQEQGGTNGGQSTNDANSGYGLSITSSNSKTDDDRPRNFINSPPTEPDPSPDPIPNQPRPGDPGGPQPFDFKDWTGDSSKWPIMPNTGEHVSVIDNPYTPTGLGGNNKAGIIDPEIAKGASEMVKGASKIGDDLVSKGLGKAVTSSTTNPDGEMGNFVPADRQNGGSGMGTAPKDTPTSTPPAQPPEIPPDTPNNAIAVESLAITNPKSPPLDPAIAAAINSHPDSRSDHTRTSSDDDSYRSRGGVTDPVAPPRQDSIVYPPPAEPDVPLGGFGADSNAHGFGHMAD